MKPGVLRQTPGLVDRVSVRPGGEGVSKLHPFAGWTHCMISPFTILSSHLRYRTTRPDRPSVRVFRKHETVRLIAEEDFDLFPHSDEMHQFLMLIEEPHELAASDLHFDHSGLCFDRLIPPYLLLLVELEGLLSHPLDREVVNLVDQLCGR